MCKYCPINDRCSHKKERKDESLFKRFVDYIFKSDTYYSCEYLHEYKMLEPARKVLRNLGIEPSF
ncbi:MAG: hypothetical protein QXP77_03090 [Candidatus Aenigmatarchaeota archaeon]